MIFLRRTILQSGLLRAAFADDLSSAAALLSVSRVLRSSEITLRSKPSRLDSIQRVVGSRLRLLPYCRKHSVGLAIGRTRSL